MRIGGTESLGGLFGGRMSLAPVRAITPTDHGESSNRQAMLDYDRAVLDLRGSVEGLGESSGVRSEGQGSLREALSIDSSKALGLDVTETFTRAESTEEVVGAISKYGTVEAEGPGFNGASTVSVSLSGDYDGSLGDAELTLQVEKSGVLGKGSTRLSVLDSEGTEIASTSLRNGYEPGTEVELMAGVTVALGEGQTEKGDSMGFRLTAASGEPSKVGGEAELGGSLGVTDGSLMVEGTEIRVNADDTVNDLLSRINEQADGVEASFNSTTGHFVLQRTQGGPLSLDYGSDTSGFLEAAHLDDAPIRRGADGETRQALSKVEAFRDVRSGTLDINGHKVEIDVDEDSLFDVLDRIEAADPSVTASYSTLTDRVTLGSTGASFVLGEDSTGFLSAIAIEDGEYETEQVEERRATQVIDRDALKRSLMELGETLSSMFAFEMSGLAGARADAARELLRVAIEGSLKDAGLELDENRVRTDYGLKLDLDRATQGVARFDSGQLEQALRKDPTAVLELLGGRKGGQRGLLDRLGAAADSLTRGLGGSGGGESGLAIDVDA